MIKDGNHRFFLNFKSLLFFRLSPIFLFGIFMFFFGSHVSAAPMPSLLQSAQNTETDTDSISAQFSSPTHEGNLLIAVFSSMDSTIPITMGDWHVAAYCTLNDMTQIIYYKTASGLEDEVTVIANSQSSMLNLQLFEYSGAGIFDGAIKLSSGHGSSLSTGEILLSQNNQLVFAVFMTNGNDTFENAWTNDFTKRSQSSTASGSFVSADLYSNTEGQSVSTSFTNAETVHWMGQIVSFVTKSPEIELTGYRFYENIDSADVGDVLGDENTSSHLPENNQPFRLRAKLHIQNNSMSLNALSFKLQYAEKNEVCDAEFYGERYEDITFDTPIAYYDNVSVIDKAAFISNINDPFSIDAVGENYVESNPFTNQASLIHSGQDAIWDFPLVENGIEGNKGYCFRVVFSDDSLLDAYSVFPAVHMTSLPFGNISEANQINNGSGNVELYLEVGHELSLNARAKIEYETNQSGLCVGPWTRATLIGNILADFIDSLGAPDINNANEYQIGSGTDTNIITLGINSLYNLYWDSLTDISNANGTQCLKLTINDELNDQKEPHLYEVIVDNTAPSITSVSVLPETGISVVDDVVTVSFTSNEVGLELGLFGCSVNNVDVSESFIDNIDQTYTVSYTVSVDDDNWTAGNLPIFCQFKDSVGNATTVSSFTDGNTLAGTVQ